MTRLTFFLGLMLLAACGLRSGDSGDGSPSPSLAVCQESDTWTRPTIEQQREMIWSRPRYAGRDESRMRETFDEPVFTWHGGNSEMFDSWPLHGLWSADDSESRDSCAEGYEVARGRYVDLYLLTYRARDIQLRGTTYDVTVEPAGRGFQHIEFPNALYPAGGTPVAYGIRVVTPAGDEVAFLRECASDDKTRGCAPGERGA